MRVDFDHQEYERSSCGAILDWFDNLISTYCVRVKDKRMMKKTLPNKVDEAAKCFEFLLEFKFNSN